MKQSSIWSRLLRYEPIFFVVVILAHFLPLYLVTWFVTVDGPAHLYNANIISNYFNGFSHDISRYFYFNNNPEPNWTGHFLFVVFLQFFPSFLAEKLVLTLYVVLLPVSFRLLIRSQTKENSFTSYLIFPFIYNLPFCFGFYNFSFGLPVLFFGIYFWITTSSFDWKRGVLFFFLVMLAYFSHLFSSLLLLFVTGLLLFSSMLTPGKKWKLDWIRYKSQVIAYAIAAIPVVFMVLYFIESKGLSGYKGKITSLPISELFSYVGSTRTLICWTYDKEYAISIFMGIVFLLVIGIIIYNRIVERGNKPFIKNDRWFAMSMFMLLLFFIIPDSAASGGFISVRVLLFFHLFLITWIAVQTLKPLVGIGIAFSSLIISFSLMAIHVDIAKGLDKDAKELMEITDHMGDNSNLLPLNYGSNWLHLNLSNYAGTTKNIIVLDNYEPNYPQFPLKWQTKAYPYDLIGNFASSHTPCITLAAYEKESGIQINYVLRWQYNSSLNDSCTLITNELLSRNFELVFTSSAKRAELFKRK